MTKRRQKHVDLQEERVEREPLRARTPKQAEYIAALSTQPQVISLGPAGTGKSYIAAVVAADLLRTRRIEKIILTRPNVPGGRSLGFFPGTLNDKFTPWAAQILHDLETRLGKGMFDYALRKGQIDLVPFEVMRGRSWANAFILLDEAQNTTPDEIKLFLTRIGEGSRVVINGDIRQSDIKATSGLAVVLDLVRRLGLPVSVIEFTLDDVVRSDLCALWLRAFEEPDYCTHV